MVETMDEYFGSCTNHGECEAACPKEISIDVIALMNADYRKAKFKNRKSLSRVPDPRPWSPAESGRSRSVGPVTVTARWRSGSSR
jgi:ferredoxin